MLSQYGVVLELLSQVESISFLFTREAGSKTKSWNTVDSSERVCWDAGTLLSSKWNFIHNKNYQLLQFMIVN